MNNDQPSLMIPSPPSQAMTSVESRKWNPLDHGLLANFEEKLPLIRDRVRGVAEKFHTACYLVGRPGVSKTYTVKRTLDELDVPWVCRNARMTPMGLFD